MHKVKFNNSVIVLAATFTVALSVRYMPKDWQVPHGISELFEVTPNEKSPYGIYELKPKEGVVLKRVTGNMQWEWRTNPDTKEKYKVNFYDYMIADQRGATKSRLLLRIEQADNAPAEFLWETQATPVSENIPVVTEEVVQQKAKTRRSRRKQEAKEPVAA